jgi:hypothetical protein
MVSVSVPSGVAALLTLDLQSRAGGVDRTAYLGLLSSARVLSFSSVKSQNHCQPLWLSLLCLCLSHTSWRQATLQIFPFSRILQEVSFKLISIKKNVSN